MTKKSVLIDLGKLKNLYTGLGQVSLQYGSCLKALPNQPEFDFRYLIPLGFEEKFGDPPTTELLSFKRRHFPNWCQTYDLWHAIHQDSPFMPAKKKGCKYLLTIHDLNFLKEKNESKAKNRLIRLQKKVDQADYITFISHFSKDEAKKHLEFYDKPLKVIYNGVDPVGLAEEIRPKFLPAGEFLFSIGTLLKKKNFHVLIPFLKKLPLINLVIVGQNQNAYADELRSLIEKYGLTSRVILPGPVDEKTKAYLYRHCKAFCFPSLHEGFGMPVIEAMHVGKPVFLSRTSSLPEIGGDYAYYWDSFEPEQMANVYQRGLIDFNRDQDDIILNQNRHAAQFTWEKNCQEYLAIYRTLLNS